MAHGRIALVFTVCICTARVDAQATAPQASYIIAFGTLQPYGEIAVMRPDGSDVHVLTDNATEEGAPAWIANARR